MTNDDCACRLCRAQHGRFYVEDNRRSGFLLFTAVLLLAAVLACVKIHDRSSIWIKAHHGETK